MLTLVIVGVTSVISFITFQNPILMSRYDFSPFRIRERKEYYRVLTHAFLHADWVHLIINMVVLYSFGAYVEREFKALENAGHISSGPASYLLLYFSAVLVSSITTYFKKKNDPYYAAVGASGAVSAVLFTSIFFSPLEKILLYGVLPLPGIVFGVLYLAYSTYMGKREGDRVNHDAHLWGAIYGILFPLFLDPSLIRYFLNQLGI